MRRLRLSVTIRQDTALRLRRYALRERKPVSHIVEAAIENFLRQQFHFCTHVPTTPGRFLGRVSRRETYRDT